MKKLLIPVFTMMFFAAQAQTYCPNDAPQNVSLADSPWPIAHRNSSAQASTCFNAPSASDSLEIKFCASPSKRCSPWMLYTEKYSNGKRMMLGSHATHCYKAIDDSLGLRLIDSLRIDFSPTDFSFNHIILKNRRWITLDYVPNLNTTAFYAISDADTTNPYSPLVYLDTFYLPTSVEGKAGLRNVTNDGWLAYITTANVFGIIKSDFSSHYALTLPLDPDEIAYHNNFPVDEHNNFYIVTTKRMMKLNWTFPNITVVWTSPYDFIGDGPTNTSAAGSGTTPTLVGFGDGNDKLVVVCDGHNQNNLVAFWRDSPPSNWTALPGQDSRVASITPLPGFQYLGGIYQSVENSPTAYDYSIGCAQYNGFENYSCDNAKGVVKLDWDTLSNTMAVAWANNTINFNNVLTYSSATNLVYGNGKESDCFYYFYALDWNTGNIVIRKQLGQEEKWNDYGDNISISDDNTLIDPTAEGFYQVKIIPKDVSTFQNQSSFKSSYSYYPNPATNQLTFVTDAENASGWIEIKDILGRVVLQNRVTGVQATINTSTLPEGFFVLTYYDEFYKTKVFSGKIILSK
jgi:Secretion system C-terminal sorting domain